MLGMKFDTFIEQEFISDNQLTSVRVGCCGRKSDKRARQLFSEIMAELEGDQVNMNNDLADLINPGAPTNGRDA